MHTKAPVILRRNFLTGIGATAFGSALLRPLIARAQGGPPKRILFIHRPCGSIQKQWFPQTGTATDFQLGPISNVFEPVKANMVLLNEITNAWDEGQPDYDYDEHGMGLMCMMTCAKPQRLPNYVHGMYIVGGGKSIDQILYDGSPMLKGTTKGPIQLGGSKNLSQGSYPGPRIMSYTGPGTAGGLYPEVRPDAALMNVFGSFVPPSSTTPAAAVDNSALLRLRAQNKGVLDLVAKDLNRLKAMAPASQRARMDEHLASVQLLFKEFEAGTGAGGSPTPSAPAAGCAKPTMPAVPTADPMAHEPTSRQMLQLIRAAFTCDVTRVATFQFAEALSPLQFQKIIPSQVTDADGHHDVSHGSNAAHKAAIDRWYSQIVADFLVEMKNTPDGAGTSLLDNTLVYYFTEINDGGAHGTSSMPVAMFGGKSLGLAGGRHLKFGGRRINDVWLAVANAFGVPLTTIGEAKHVKGPVSGLFG